MPRVRADELRRIGCLLFEQVGCTPADARTVVDHLVDSSLYGHDSHGQIRIYEYIGQIRDGIFDPKGTPHIESDRPCAAVVDGGGALGQIGGTFATQLAIDKARQHGVATVTLRNTSHVGRVGAYPLQIARAGLVGIVFCNAGHLGRQIAPYGGLDGKLSTNPIAFAAPRRSAEPILVDMTTSVCAEGKIRVASNKGVALPAGCIIDAQGNPSTDPQDYLGDPPGAMLPLGGPVAYKGYCLSFIVEILGGALSGQGCAAGERVMQSNGLCITAYHIDHFADRDAYFDEIEALIGHVRSSRIDPNVGEILLPGDPEYRSAKEREQAGIPIDNTTWERIQRAGSDLGLDVHTWQTLD
ncbi:MAG: Ldh family oxidoreductase [Candidatus Latescibacterota bacterium]